MNQAFILRNWRRSAFTLTELMVVMGLIGVLVGILMPAVTIIRSAAKVAVCSDRQRQVSLAIFVYTDRCKGMMPRTQFNETGTIEYGRAWYTDISEDWNRQFNAGGDRKQKNADWAQQFFCSEDATYKTVDWESQVNHEFYFSIGYNNWIGDPQLNASRSYIRRNSIISHDKTVLIGDSWKNGNADKRGYFWIGQNSGQTGIVYPRHKSNSIALITFVDGHLEKRRAKTGPSVIAYGYYDLPSTGGLGQNFSASIPDNSYWDIY